MIYIGIYGQYTDLFMAEDPLNRGDERNNPNFTTDRIERTCGEYATLRPLIQRSTTGHSDLRYILLTVPEHSELRLFDVTHIGFRGIYVDPINRSTPPTVSLMKADGNVVFHQDLFNIAHCKRYLTAFVALLLSNQVNEANKEKIRENLKAIKEFLDLIKQYMQPS